MSDLTYEEKLKLGTEMIDGFIEKIVERAKTANSVNKMMNEDASNSSQESNSFSAEENFSAEGNFFTEEENFFTAEDVVESDEQEDFDTSDVQQSQSTSESTAQTTTEPVKQQQTTQTANESDRYAQSQSNATDFSADEEDEPLSKEVEAIFYPDDWKKAFADSFMSCKQFYDNENMKKKLENERKSTTQPKQCNDNVVYKKNTATFNGQPFEYKVLQREVNWGTAFTKSFSMDDKITNLDKLNEKIIEDIKLTFGDLSRITEIAVISGMLILNGVQYYPLCKDKDFLNGLPFDCADYFKSGLLAEIFDFGYLYYMPYLTSLKIDSMDFTIRKFAYDIGVKGKFKVPYVFKAFKSLQYFELCDTTFAAPGRDVNIEVEESIERHSRAADIYDNYILTNANSFTNWTLDNLKSYACNRGEKGFLRYSGGVIARTGMFLGSGIGNLGVRTVGSIVKGGAKLLKKAFQDDI